MIGQSVEQAFGHEAAADELGAADVRLVETSIREAGLADDGGLLVFANKKRINEVAVFHFNPVDAVAGFHGGIGREDVAQHGLQSHGPGTTQIRSDLATGAADLVAGHAESAEHFAIRCIALGSEGGELAELGIERFGLLFREQRWRVGRLGDSGTFAKFGAGSRIAHVGLIGPIRPIKCGTNLLRTPRHLPHSELRHHTFGALFRAAPADAAVFPLRGSWLAGSGVEFAVLVDLEDAFRIARDSDVCPEVGRHRLVGDDHVVQLGACVDAELGAEEVHLHTTRHAENVVLVPDPRREAHPSLDSEWTLQCDLAVDPCLFAAVEEKHFAENAAELLLKFFERRVIAEHGGESFDRGSVEIGLRQCFIKQSTDDGPGSGFGAGHGVQGGPALRRLERRIQREELRCGIRCP